MNPAANAATSGGLSFALATILVWLLGLVHVSVPPEVVGAFTMVITAAAGSSIHFATKPVAVAAAPVPVAQP